ncbi:unnamed protein product [Nippostrongylus brasiliensis]|uniref:LEM domain-containing protein n=1 Tax=Nippostrongylus brasiliensis TaxID=27835 RepID=A0A0N4XXU2_NIPBR|nr:unnamed protein product [Nippostrongylus brasiliensis]
MEISAFQESKSSALATTNGNNFLTVPKMAVNGRVVSAVHQRPPKSVAIDIPEDFCTARTSRDQCNNHLSMKELMRVVRAEEGLKVTPRTEQTNGVTPGIYSPRWMTDRKWSRGGTPSPPQALDAKKLAYRERARRAVFDPDGDITARTFSPKTTGTRRKRSSGSIATISGDEHLNLAQPPPVPSTTSYLKSLPHMVVAVITISFAWLANLMSFVLR